MLISDAWAQAADSATDAAGDPGILVTLAPLVFVFFIFYLMVIRPQNKRLIEHRKMINELNKGDKVVTGGGLVGTVKKLQGDDEVVLELGHGVEVTALRHTIISIRGEKKA